MLIKDLKLNNYRNYKEIEISFDPKLNIIIGKNGIGKTNILESLIFISNTKSFRTLDDSDLIRKGEDYLRIICNSEADEYKAVVNKEGKHLYINNLPIKKTSEFIGRLNCILFKPSDLELLNQSPKERRRILDLEIGKVSKKYLDALLKYNSLLKDKNKILKEQVINNTYLELIDEQMLPNIKIILEERKEFIEIINNSINEYYKKISNNDIKLKVIYKKCCEIENIKEMLDKNKDKDLYYHYASVGPHHDDFEFMMDENELTSVASQGQTRMAIIAFKLALMDYIIYKSNKIPILLLDDILSELDIGNRERLLKTLPNRAQVIITGTDLLGISIKETYKLIKLKEEEDGGNKN